MAKQAWDYIVVGAGSAGSVLAHRLSESPGNRVLVLEAGGWDAHPMIQLPVGLFRLPTRLDWGLDTEPDETLGGRRERWSAGKVVGGGSSVNGMIWVRGARHDFDTWEKLGCSGWSYADVLPYFRRSESFEGGADEFRGDSGPQHVSYGHSSHPLNDAFITAATQIGLPANPDYNGRSQIGASPTQVSQRRGLRWSTARGYLATARRRENCTIWTDTVVQKVIIEGGQARGVVVVRDGQRHELRCDREVILSGGTMASPKLLMLSGIGPADQLRSLGIDPVVDAPEVGANVLEHSCAPITFEVNIRSLNQETSPLGFVRHGLDFVARGRGAATATPAQAMVFTGFDPGSDITDVEIMFAPFAINRELRNGEMKVVLPKTPTARALVSPVRPHGKGTIRLRSADPSASPIINRPLYGHPDDLRDMIRGIRLAREIAGSPAFGKYVVSETSPSLDARTDQELAAQLQKLSYGGRHPVGSCRMGSDEGAVVDPSLRVRGVEGLRVVDASVMPALTSGNTNAPTVMIGERGADLVLTS